MLVDAETEHGRARAVKATYFVGELNAKERFLLQSGKPGLFVEARAKFCKIFSPGCSKAVNKAVRTVVVTRMIFINAVGTSVT